MRTWKKTSLVTALSVLFVGIVVSSCSPIRPLDASSPTPALTPVPSSIAAQTNKAHLYVDGRVIVGGDDQPIELIDNPRATDPTFAELVAFLEKDRTDEYSYIVGPPKNAFVCSDFAETIHNNAEAAGIRAAWVGIDIEGETEAHALNAFETTDLGLVYIDCTGKGLWDDPANRSSVDRRARVEIGKPYALAGMNTPASQFWFYISSNPARNSLKLAYPSIWELFSGETYEERKLKSERRLEWHRTHDIEALGQNWMQEWLQKYAVELSECGRVLETTGTWYEGSGSWEGRWDVKMLDRWEISWFQPDQVLVKEEYIGGPNWRGFMEFEILHPDAKVEQNLIKVDGFPIAWEIGWKDNEGNWFKPFQVWSKNELVSTGAVKDIHIHWGE